ncbi:MAG TPA: BON domain-containing protein [Opitutaceae bacterium]|nr:BON domain-containing protein [Opitutaceae bacterium]
MKTILILAGATALLCTGCNKADNSSSLAQKTDSAMQKTENAVSNAADKTKDAAVDAKNAISAKLTEWKLTPSDIKADLDKSGRVVRDKTMAAGEKVGGALDNARIVTVINAKYVADSDLSALKINVDADNGVVTLNGTVRSADFIGKAIALALDTDGVRQVISLLRVE